MIHQTQSRWVDTDAYAGVSQADSAQLAECVHFWDMHEAAGVTQLTDVVSGGVITPVITAAKEGAFLNLIGNLGGTASGQASLIDCAALGTSDWMLLVSGRAVAGAPAENCGHLGFYWLNAGSYDIRLHAYYATLNNGWRTLPYPPNWVRTAGQLYTHAVVKRGPQFEHYALPAGFIDSVDVSKVPNFSQLGALDYAAPLTTYMGHGGYGTPYNYGAGREILGSPWPAELGSSSGNVAQDFSGIAVHKFTGGAPPREAIVKALRWCETDWSANAAGKRLYPGLIV